MACHAARGAAGTASRVPSGFGGGPYSLCVQPSAPRPRTHVHGRATLPSDASMRSRCGQPGGRSARRGAAVWAEDRVRTLAGGGGRAAGAAVTPRGAGAAVRGRADAAIRPQLAVLRLVSCRRLVLGVGASRLPGRHTAAAPGGQLGAPLRRRGVLVSAREPAHQLLARAGARAGEPPDPPLDSSVPDCVCAAGAGVQRRLSWAHAARPDASSSRRGGSGHLSAEHGAVNLAATTASAGSARRLPPGSRQLRLHG